jgi:hypothetical protein
MNKLFYRSFAFVLSFIFLLGFATSPVKAGVSGYPVEATPKIEVKIAVGSTDVAKTTLLEDLKNELISRGVDVSMLDFSYAQTQNFNPADTTLWSKYDHNGYWNERSGSYHYPVPYDNPDNDNPVNWNNDPHIVITDAGKVLTFFGYGRPSYNDFMLSLVDSSQKKEFSFDVDTAASSWHTLMGAGFLFNSKIVNNLLYSYAIMVTQNGLDLIMIDGVDVDDFHNHEGSNLYDFPKTSLVARFTADNSVTHHFAISIDNNKLTVTDNGHSPLKIPASPMSWGVAEAYFLNAQTTYTSLYSWQWDATLGHFILYGDSSLTNPVEWNILDAAIAYYDGLGKDIRDMNYWGDNGDGTVYWNFYNPATSNYEDLYIPYSIISGSSNDTYLTNFDLPKVLGNRFGPIAAYSGHNCSELSMITFTNLEMNLVTEANLPIDEAFAKIDWKAGTDRYLINFDNLARPVLTTARINTFGTKMKAKGVDYIAVGDDASKPQQLAIIKANGNLGTYLDEDSTTIVHDVIDYIFGKVHTTIVNNMVDLRIKAMGKPYILGIGDTEGSVTKNITLLNPVSDLTGAVLTWLTSSEGTITHSGSVTRPSFTTGDKTVKLTLRVVYEGVTVNRYYDFKVKKLPITALEKLNLDLAMVDVTYAEGDSATHVTQNLGLTSTLPQGSTIVWSADKPALVDNAGKVTRPGFYDGDQTVVLSAVVTNGGETSTVTFNLTLIKAEKTDKEKAEEDAKGSLVEFAEGENEAKALTALTMTPTGAVNGSTITWTSDHPEILNEKGIVARPTDKDITVKLTATITNGSATTTKVYSIVVPKQNSPLASLGIPALIGLVVILIGGLIFFLTRKKKTVTE